MLRKYKVDSIKGEGYAYIVIDTDTGFFAAVSDHGNYACRWSHPGKEFRAFLVGIRPDYLFDKLMMGRSDKWTYDSEAARASIREAIDKLEDPEEKVFEEKLLKGEDPESGLSFDLDEEAGFDDWMELTRLEEAGRHFVQVPEAQCTQFCTVIFPRFQELLKAELEAEKRDRELAEEIRKSKPVINTEAVRRVREAMTGWPAEEWGIINEELHTVGGRCTCQLVKDYDGNVRTVSVATTCPLHGVKKDV